MIANNVFKGHDFYVDAKHFNAMNYSFINRLIIKNMRDLQQSCIHLIIYIYDQFV